jgi:hypothetical protein
MYKGVDNPTTHTMLPRIRVDSTWPQKSMPSGLSSIAIFLAHLQADNNSQKKMPFVGAV